MKTSGEDIAKAAGVSVATVSAVFSGLARKRRISRETEQRIREIAKQMNYIPNSIARSFRKGRTSMVGILLPVPNDNGYTRIVNELETSFFENGYFASFAFWQTKDEQRMAAESILSRMPEAVVTVEPQHLKDPLDIPVVTLFNRDPRFDCITLDRKAIWLDSMNYLTALGHTRIAAPALQRRHSGDECDDYSDAADFFLSEMKRRGLSTAYSNSLIQHLPENQKHPDLVGEKIAEWLLSFPAEIRPTAIILDEDIKGAYLIRALARRGFHSPGNISIVSSGNSLLGRATVPAISTFGEGSEDTLSRKITERILLRLRTKEEIPPELIHVKYTLIPRESVNPFTGKEWQ